MALAAVIWLPIVLLRVGRRGIGGRCGGGVMLRWVLRRHFLGAALDDFVEFAAVQPDSAALRALIDFDALPLTHGEGNVANRARHGFVGMGHDQFSVLRSKMYRRRTVGIGSAGRTAT